MNESTDAALLARFAQSEDEEAFALLVQRHIHLVHSVALRQTAHPQQAGEVTQAVFIILARKARLIGPRVVLSGWLYHTARLTAANHQRAEMRRRRREEEAMMQSPLEKESTETVWQEMAPLLDDVMGRLRPADRDAILLRYFENKTLPEIGENLGLGERAAQKRVSRALEKLRRLLSRHGVTSTAALIGAALSAHSVSAAPNTLASVITVTAVEGSATTVATSTLINSTLKIMAWTKAKTAVVVGAALLLTAGITTVLVTQSRTRQLDRSAEAVIEKVTEVNTGLPAAQVQAKQFIFSAMALRKIPEAANWCETLNVKGKIWPLTPTNTAFAINSQVAGRSYSRNEIRAGTIAGKTVVFFETGHPGWNQAGGAELLPSNAEGIAVAFADGTAMIVPSAEMVNLRWTP